MIKKSITACLLLVFALYGISQNNEIKFKKGGSLKNGASAAGYTHSKDNLYIVGGFNNTSFFNNYILEYNLSKNKWTKNDIDFPTSTWGNAEYRSTSMEKLYILNGVFSQGFNHSFISYDVTNGETFNIKGKSSSYFCSRNSCYEW